MPPLVLERDLQRQPGVSLLVRYLMLPCNACLILLATATLGLAVLLLLNGCTWLHDGHWPPRGPALGLSSRPGAKAWAAGRVTDRLPAGVKLRGATCIFWDRMGPFWIHGPWTPFLGLSGGWASS